MSRFVPTLEQREILEHQGPLLVLAGAGVGKTAVLIQRIANAIEQDGVPPEQILALTFTRAAAQEMRQRIAAELTERQSDASPDAIWAGTYHAFAGEIVREFGVRLGIAPNARLLSDAGKWALLDQMFDRLRFDALPVRNAGSVFDNILKFVGDAQNHLLTPDEIDGFVQLTRQTAGGEEVDALLTRWADLSRAYRAYQDVKLDAGALDYGDQILYAVRLLEEFPDVAAELRRRSTHVYVDEYQDTNSAQRRLLLGVIGPNNPNLFVIGDDDQAIFRFQGATVRNILGLPEERSLAGAKPTVKTLVLNRRSRPPLLDLANPIAARIHERRQKDLRHLLDGRAVIGAFVADGDSDEAGWIADTIKRLQASAASDDPLADWDAYAVLCRQRSLMQTAATALEAVGVPFQLTDPSPLLERWEVDELRALLQVIATPDNDVALARVLHSPRWRIGDADQWALARWRRAQTAQPASGGEGTHAYGGALLDAVLVPDEVPGLASTAHRRLALLGSEIQDLAQAARTTTVDELVERAIARGGYRKELAAGAHPDDAEALHNLDRLQQLAATFAGGEGLRGLRAFLRFLDRADEAGDADLGEVGRPVSAPNTVKLSTVHRAKGLEWDVVFVPGLARGRFAPRTRKTSGEDQTTRAPYPLRAERAGLPRFDPAAFSDDESLQAAQEHRDQAIQPLEEDDERRLLYVAITRAKRRLYLSRAHWYGNLKRPSEPSPFWTELLEAELCEVLGEAVASPANPNPRRPPLSASPAGAERELRAAVLAERRIAAGDAGALVRELLGERPGAAWDTARVEADALLARLATRGPVPNRPSKLVEPPITSYSALDTFQTCERRYRYAFLDKLPRRPSAAIAGGGSLHRALAALNVQAGDGELPDPSDLPGNVEAALRDQPQQLRAFRESRFNRRAATAVEQPFTLALETGVIHGTIDRADRLPDGSIEIVDFKSGKQRPDAALRDDLQLPIYALAAAELYDAPADTVRASFFFLDVPVEWSLPWGAERAAVTRDQLNALLQRLQAGAFPKTDERRHCRHCDFKHICKR